MPPLPVAILVEHLNNSGLYINECFRIQFPSGLRKRTVSSNLIGQFSSVDSLKKFSNSFRVEDRRKAIRKQNRVGKSRVAFRVKSDGEYLYKSINSFILMVSLNLQSMPHRVILRILIPGIQDHSLLILSIHYFSKQ